MTVEHKIYSPWAFKTDEDEKARMNIQIYNELFDKFKIYSPSRSNCEKDKAQVVIVAKAPTYNEIHFSVEKNEVELTSDELALIYDHGNLCFGHMGTTIFTD
jgi:hypothetical protein